MAQFPNQNKDDRQNRAGDDEDGCGSHLLISGRWAVGGVRPGKGQWLSSCTARRPAHFFVSGPHDSLDISPHVKVAFNLDAQGIAGAYEVFQNYVDGVS